MALVVLYLESEVISGLLIITRTVLCDINVKCPDIPDRYHVPVTKGCNLMVNY